MSWVQLLVLCAAIFLVGYLLALRFRTLEGTVAEGLGRLERLFEASNVKASAGTELTLEHLRRIRIAVSALRKSLQAFQSALGNTAKVAQHFRDVRDEVKRIDETEGAQKAWEKERQEQHEKWARAARAEADKLGKEGRKA